MKITFCLETLKKIENEKLQKERKNSKKLLLCWIFSYYSKIKKKKVQVIKNGLKKLKTEEREINVYLGFFSLVFIIAEILSLVL